MYKYIHIYLVLAAGLTSTRWKRNENHIEHKTIKMDSLNQMLRPCFQIAKLLVGLLTKRHGNLLHSFFFFSSLEKNAWHPLFTAVCQPQCKYGECCGPKKHHSGCARKMCRQDGESLTQTPQVSAIPVQCNFFLFYYLPILYLQIASLLMVHKMLSVAHLSFVHTEVSCFLCSIAADATDLLSFRIKMGTFIYNLIFNSFSGKSFLDS